MKEPVVYHEVEKETTLRLSDTFTPYLFLRDSHDS